MLNILFCVSSLLLILLSLYLFFLLKKERSFRQSIPCNHCEDVLNAASIPIFYKIEGVYEANKAFYRAFGTFTKEAFARLDILPKYGQHSLELIFDNGIAKNVLVYCSALHGKENALLGHTGILFDISEVQKSKEHLMLQKERLELAIEASGDGLWDWDMKNDTIFFSKTWKHIMGYSDNEKPSSLSSWLNLVHPRDMALVNEQLKKHLDKESAFFFIEHRLRDSEPLRWITVRGQAEYDKYNKPVRMSGTIRDITSRKIHEEAERKQLALFVLFFENLPSIAFIKNAAGNYLYLNRHYQRYIGFKTWKHKTAKELFDAKTAEEISESDRLATYEGIIEQELTLPTEEGIFETFNIFKFVIETEEGEKLLCGFGVMINKSFR